ncbi:MAG: hypothetical protein ACKOCO_01870 [Bacteroidota bacterium]
MLRFSSLILLLLITSVASAQIEDPQFAFRDLKRGLDGTWFMPTDRGDRLEIWSVQDDSTLVGRSVRIKPENGDTVLLERLRIELRDTNITYITASRVQGETEKPRSRSPKWMSRVFMFFPIPKTMIRRISGTCSSETGRYRSLPKASKTVEPLHRNMCMNANSPRALLNSD